MTNKLQICVLWISPISYILSLCLCVCVFVCLCVCVFVCVCVCALGRGPRQKNGKILTELSFFAVFNHKNDLEKVWKSRNEFKLVGFKVEKKWPVLKAKLSKNIKKAQNGQK